MTPKQMEQFNRMRSALRVIAFYYETPEQLRRSAEKNYGLNEIEVISLSYRNIKLIAKSAVFGVREAKEKRSIARGKE